MSGDLIVYLESVMRQVGSDMVDGVISWGGVHQPCQVILQTNKTGTSQVGAISRAQKYSRNNYWKYLKKNNFFPKKIFGKKVEQCRKT